MFDSELLLHGDALYAGAIDASVRALDARSLTERWKTRLRGTKVNGIALAGDTLIATVAFTGRSGPGLVYGVDPRTGAQTMAVTARDVSTAPAVDSSTVYFGTATGSIVTRSGALYRLDLHTRKITSVAEGFACVGVPVIDGGDVLIAAEDGAVRCLDRETGSVRWRFMTRKFLSGSPGVGGDMVLMGGFDHGVYAIDRVTGAQRWHVETGGPVRGTPTASGDAVFASSYDENVYALALSSGKRRWSYRTTSYVMTTPLVHEDVVIVGCNDGSVHAIDTASGKARWVWAGNDPRQRGIIASPVVVGDRIVVASRTGEIEALWIASGKPMTAPRAPTAIMKTVTPIDRQITAHDVGAIALAGGRIVACDPFSSLHDQAFDHSLASGEHRVVVGTLSESEDSQVVAYLTVHLKDAKPVGWEVATGVKDGSITVDSGCAAIMSEDAARKLLSDAAAEERFGEAAEDQMNSSYGSGKPWAVIGIKSAGNVDSAVCYSGAGDGSYRAHWGLDAKGRRVALALDFEMTADTLSAIIRGISA